MPTNDERREVAETLRSGVGTTDSMSDDDFIDWVHGVVSRSRDGHILDRLADLIEPEERTCHDVSFDSREFVCSWCGCHIDVLGIESEPTMWLGGSPIEPSFCPNCGARVEEGE